MGRILNRRRVMGESLPYDYRVEYLESTGTQQLNTEIKTDGDFTMELVFVATPMSREADFVGSAYSGAPIGSTIIGFYNKFIFAYNKPNPRIDTPPFSQSELQFKIKYISANNQRQLYVNNVVYTGSGSNYAGYDIYLFSGGQNYNKALIKLKYFSISKNGNLLRDMFPVVKDDVGYMYDKVSGQLFGNSGTGSFVIGPRV